MTSATVPIRYARSLLQALESQGFDSEQVIQWTGVSEYLNNPDSPEHIPAELYNRLHSRAIWLVQDESFGMHLQQAIPAGSFRMMCMCVIHCDNLQNALNRAVEFNNFCRSLTQLPPVHLNAITFEGEVATAHIPDNQPLFGPADVIAVAHTLAVWRRFCGWLVGRNIEPISVLFKGSAPDNIEGLRALFHCPLLFDQDTNGFEFPDHYARLPLIHTEESLKDFLRMAPFQLVAKDDDTDDNVVSLIRQLVGNDFSKDFPSVTAVAECLNMSVRTLRRRLNKEGMTFQKLKDNTRMNAAIQYLNRPELKIGTVSALMGFDEPSAFHRSFKKWTGQTPGEYRASVGRN